MKVHEELSHELKHFVDSTVRNAYTCIIICIYTRCVIYRIKHLQCEIYNTANKDAVIGRKINLPLFLLVYDN
jgi:hypothetical protein